ncbi:MAG: hypothetical protein R6W78_12400 [Bacteroidales bacterium]
MKTLIPKNLPGRLSLVFLFMCLFTIAPAQDFIINDTPCSISDELVVSPNGKIMLYDVLFRFQKLSSTYKPHGEIMDLRPYGNRHSTFFGVTYYADNDLAVVWSESEWVDEIYWSYLYVKQFDSLGISKFEDTIIDSVKGSYVWPRISKTTDPDNELGLAFVLKDTLFAMYFNPETNTCSPKKVLLTGSGTQNIETVDFLTNTDVRVIWRDVNINIRHKMLAKSGETVIAESIIINRGSINYDMRFLKYASISNGNFMLAEYHENPITYQHGIETRKFSNDAVAISDPVWMCDSLEPSMSDDISAYSHISMQDDGKAVVVWSKRYWDTVLWKEIKFLYMQLLDENGNKFGSTFLPTTINTESYKKSYGVRQEWPKVRLHNDTILLLWNNYNEELLPQVSPFMNVQRYTLPIETAISSIPASPLKHSVFANHNTGDIWLIVESDIYQNSDIVLFDVLGRPLYTMQSLVLQPGRNEILLKESTRLKGNFAIYQINTGDKKFCGRFIW